MQVERCCVRRTGCDRECFNFAESEAVELLRRAMFARLSGCGFLTACFLPVSPSFAPQLPRSLMTNGDLTRIINSDEIQSALRKPKTAGAKHAPLKKNPLRNLGALVKLNPYAKVRNTAQRQSTA